MAEKSSKLSSNSCARDLSYRSAKYAGHCCACVRVATRRLFVVLTTVSLTQHHLPKQAKFFARNARLGGHKTSEELEDVTTGLLPGGKTMTNSVPLALQAAAARKTALGLALAIVGIFLTALHIEARQAKTTGAHHKVLAPTTQDNLTIFPIVTDFSRDTHAFLTLDEGLRS